MARTTEWVVEWSDEYGDIVDSAYFRTRAEAEAYRASLDWHGMVQIAKVTNHWDRNDRDNLLSRDYDYV